MTERYPITSKFNAFEDFRNHTHLGIDFAMPKGTELRSIKNGVVDRVINQPNGLGKAVYVKWEDGRTAIYGHMDKIRVTKGEEVKIGDLLGYSGNTGNVVGENGGYHLHFAVKDALDKFIDPEEFTTHIQEMNHHIDKIETVELTSESIMGDALNYFSDTIQNIEFNTITTLIHDTVLVQNFHYFI